MKHSLKTLISAALLLASAGAALALNPQPLPPRIHPTTTLAPTGGTQQPQPFIGTVRRQH